MFLVFFFLLSFSQKYRFYDSSWKSSNHCFSKFQNTFYWHINGLENPAFSFCILSSNSLIVTDWPSDLCNYCHRYHRTGGGVFKTTQYDILLDDQVFLYLIEGKSRWLINRGCIICKYSVFDRTQSNCPFNKTEVKQEMLI